MKIANEKAWSKMKRLYSHETCGSQLIEITKKWANRMEEKAARGSSIVDIIEEAWAEIDTVKMIRAQMIASAKLLSVCWVHGSIIRAWHNSKFGKPETDDFYMPPFDELIGLRYED